MTFDLDQFLNRFQLSLPEAQRLYGLPETGEADAMTLRVLEKTPRCGLPDGFAQQVMAVNKWGITDLKWWVEGFPTGANVTGVGFDHEVSLAFAAWSAVTPLTFTRTNQRGLAHVVFKVSKGPPLFDGRGNVVARADMPPAPNFVNQLNVYLDSDEAWTTGIVVNSSQQGLANALAHEIGHILGLTHSEIYGQLMYPILSTRVTQPMTEDAQRVQVLYGTKPQPAPLPDSVQARVTVGARNYEGALRLIN